MGQCASELELPIHFLWNCQIEFLKSETNDLYSNVELQTDSRMNVTFSKFAKTSNIKWYQSPSTSLEFWDDVAKLTCVFCIVVYVSALCSFLNSILCYWGYCWWFCFLDFWKCGVTLFRLDFLYSKTWQGISSQAFMFW